MGNVFDDYLCNDYKITRDTIQYAVVCNTYSTGNFKDEHKEN